jgi:hypothetical protein
MMIIIGPVIFRAVSCNVAAGETPPHIPFLAIANTSVITTVPYLRKTTRSHRHSGRRAQTPTCSIRWRRGRLDSKCRKAGEWVNDTKKAWRVQAHTVQAHIANRVSIIATAKLIIRSYIFPFPGKLKTCYKANLVQCMTSTRNGPGCTCTRRGRNRRHDRWASWGRERDAITAGAGVGLGSASPEWLAQPLAVALAHEAVPLALDPREARSRVHRTEPNRRGPVPVYRSGSVGNRSETGRMQIWIQIA